MFTSDSVLLTNSLLISEYESRAWLDIDVDGMSSAYVYVNLDHFSA